MLSQIFAKRDEYITNCKPYADKVVEYVKANPSEVFMGIMAVMLMDIESDIDEIEEYSAMSASTHLHR